MLDVGFAASEEVIEAHDAVAFAEKPITEVRPDESSASGDQDAY